MSRDGAQVHSLGAIDDYRAALAHFAHSAKGALELADLEIRRSLEWLSQAQLAHWRLELRRREDAVVTAKQDLHRARMSLTAFGHVPDCADQKAALAKAQARQAEAERKLVSVRRWTQTLQTEVDDYLGPARQLLSMLEGNIPKSLALLERMSRSLEAYLEVAPPVTTAPAPTSAEVESAALPVEPAKTEGTPSRTAEKSP